MCDASGSPIPPEFEYYEQYPLTKNDVDVTEKVTAAFKDHFGEDQIFDLGRITASEDFSHLPDAFGTPYTYWGVGCIDPVKYDNAVKVGQCSRGGHSGRWCCSLFWDPTCRDLAGLEPPCRPCASTV